MKTITFQKLTAINFKGAKSLEIIFSHNTIIKGDNGTYKSTAFDAILWCLFGKNSQNESDFSIKNTVDLSMNRQDHVVELLFVVGAVQNVAKRVYREVWTKRRGSEETVRTGHTTDYFWNNVPKSEKEYQSMVSEVCEEQIFKLLTNPLYFNVTLNETKRRDTLVKMAGEISDAQIIGVNPAYVELFAKIQGQKSLEDYKKEVSYGRLALKKQLQEIPPRIDELLKSTPKAENWQEIENEIQEKQKAIKGIDDEIQGLTSGVQKQAEEIERIQRIVYSAQKEMRSIANRLTGESEEKCRKDNYEIQKAKSDLLYTQGELATLKAQYGRTSDQLTEKQNQIETLRSQWKAKNAETFIFDESENICSACGRPFETKDSRQQFAIFSNNKADQLAKIDKDGGTLKEEIIALKETIKGNLKRVEELTAEETRLSTIASTPLAQPEPIDLNIPEYMEQKKIAEQPIPELKPVDVSDQNDIKQAIQEGIDSLRGILSTREVIVKNTARIDELKAQEKDYSQQLASLEKTEFTIDSFQKEKMNLVEKSINDKFKIVKFQLFRTLVTTGAEEQCCVTTIGGVPFSDLNHAAQLQAGIDIANALSQYYGVSAPIIVDNSEAVNTFLPTDSQLIRLYVTLDKELTIVNE